jgi:DNA-binding transcriptional LysR family regulator
MSFDLLDSLLAVAEHGAIGEAAEAIHLSQPALSRRIQQLEEELGAPLIERSGRGIVLTELGKLAATEAAQLVSGYARLKTSIREHLRLDAGTVRIGGGATAVSYLLPSAIADFRRQYPGVRFQLVEAGSRDVERAVLTDRLELGIVTLPVLSADLEVRHRVSDRVVLVAGHEHPLAKKKSVQAADLDGRELVGFEAGTAIRQIIDRALLAASVRMNVVMELRSIAAILQMVETRGSLAFVSGLGARGSHVVRVRGLRIERQLAVVAKAGHRLSPAADAFAARLQSLRSKHSALG